MIIVKVELWPMGDGNKAREIGRARIINDGTGDATHGNYRIELLKSAEYSKNDADGIYKKGVVVGFLRKRGPRHLLFEGLKDALHW